MANDLRIVIDTGVAISAALLPRSIPRQAFDAAVMHGRLLLSEETTIELDEVFRRPKFNKYVSEATRLEFLAALVRDAELVEITETVTECRDPKDDKFLQLAVSGKATHIISGDGDLLVLHPFREIKIVTPQTFLKLIPANDSPSVSDGT
jgi:putative PIN family toxin of toxin-antitoxin system